MVEVLALRPMTDIAERFLAESRSFLTSDYLQKIERCREVLTDDDVWWRADEGSNSIGNLLVTVLWAVYHAVEHFSMHTGQIIMLTKMLAGIDLVF